MVSTGCYETHRLTVNSLGIQKSFRYEVTSKLVIREESVCQPKDTGGTGRVKSTYKGKSRGKREQGELWM